MVKINIDGDIFVKILYWGCAGSGKTTTVDTLYNLTKEQFQEELDPIGDLTKIDMEGGATLYYDRGVFQSKRKKNINYHVYTVSGQTRFSPLRKKVFSGTDGCIFVWDGQRDRLEENIDSLRELKQVAEGKLITHIPLMIMINKEDLPDTMTKKEVETILKEEKLVLTKEEYDILTNSRDHTLNATSEKRKPLLKKHRIIYLKPKVKKTCALFRKHNNVYKMFKDTCERTEQMRNPVSKSINLPEL